MSVTNPKKLCHEVAKWSKEEVHFLTSRIEIKQLSDNVFPACKGKAMVGLWNEVIKRVKSKDSADKVKNNLALEKLTKDGEEKSAEVNERKSELKSLEKDIEFMELQLRKNKEDVQESDLKMVLEEENNKIQKMKGHIFQNYGRYLHLKNSELKAFQRWLDELCKIYQKNETELSEGKLLMCSHEVESVCIQLEEILTETDRINHNITGIPWQSIGKLIKEFHPSLIISSLQHLANVSTTNLKKNEEAFDSSDELEKLESTTAAQLDGNDDFGQDHSVTVQKMLQQFDIECVRIYTRYLVSKRNAENMIRQSEMEQVGIISEYQKYYELAPSTLQLAIDNLDSEIKLVSFQGCLRSFQSSVARLTGEIQKKMQAHNHLMQLKSEIDGFSKKLETNQEKIIAITEHNSAIKSMLSQHQTEVLKNADNAVCSRQGDVSKCINDFLIAMQRKYRAMSQSDMTRLRRLKLENGDNIPLCQFSLNRYHDTSPIAGGHTYCKTAQSLMLHYHTPPSGLMQKVLDYKHEISSADDSENHDVNLKCVNEKSKFLFDLVNSASQSHKLQTDSITSKYKNGLKKVDVALQQSQALCAMVQTWYDQPAQHQTPWMRAGGLTLQECKNKLETTNS